MQRSSAARSYFTTLLHVKMHHLDVYFMCFSLTGIHELCLWDGGQRRQPCQILKRQYVMCSGGEIRPSWGGCSSTWVLPWLFTDGGRAGRERQGKKRRKQEQTDWDEQRGPCKDHRNNHASYKSTLDKGLKRNYKFAENAKCSPTISEGKLQIINKK